MMDGQLMIMCELSQTADINSRMVSMQTFTTTTDAGHHSCIMENLKPSFMLINKIQWLLG